MPTTTSAAPARNWSDKQSNIFSWFASIVVGVVEHLVVRARAGTGKTTTICEAIKHAPAGLTILVCAFAKDIQLELEARLKGTDGVTVKTLHALGLSCVKFFWPDVKVSYSTDRENDLAARVCGGTAPDAIKKLVAKLCTKGRLTTPHAATPDDLITVAVEFECVPDEEWDELGYDLTYVCAYALKAMELAAAEKPVKTGIDGADMIFLPVRNRWMSKKFDAVIVDEAQDMNACQLELAQGVCRGRLIVVGDDCQAIYGFAGADSGSLDRLKTALNATELPLNVTYRCGKVIVAAAQRFVPDFVAAEQNEEGVISYLNMSKLAATAGPGDFVLSRVNAPLVSIAMTMLRMGKRTCIRGRNIGDGLVNLVRRFKARSVPELMTKIVAWENREAKKLEVMLKSASNGRAKTLEAKIEGIHDQASMLISLTENAPSVQEVTDRITALFTDDGLGKAGMITCSSVHKAKGLEADRVFVLSDTLRENTQEEKNICYVAITRAKHELVWVSKDAQ